MKRLIEQDLLAWFQASKRKPLVIRGARQVGKTWLVREFARKYVPHLIELNFEDRPDFRELFSSNDPQIILENIELALNITIDKSRSLLFLDEIQVVPEILAKLRWFAEKSPELAVIATGSLLDFVLAEHEFSMPVGRISYLHLEPLSFNEFILAKGKNKLFEYIKHYQLAKDIPDIIHQELLQLTKEYTVIGGLPDAVDSWCDNRSLLAVNHIHHDIVATYRDDFAKYSGRVPLERLEDILNSVPKLLGKKFMYTRVNKDVQAASLKRAFDLICKARICHRVSACSANGIPLASERKEHVFKAVFLDSGLALAVLGLNLRHVARINTIELNNEGGIAEQLTGQLLRTIEPSFIESDLFYWTRENKSTSAEIDYIIQHGPHLIPVALKAGATGRLRSLHYFMHLKKLKYALRFCADQPNLSTVEVKLADGQDVEYKLLSLPFYLIGEIHRLLDDFVS